MNRLIRSPAVWLGMILILLLVAAPAGGDDTTDPDPLFLKGRTAQAAVAKQDAAARGTQWFGACLGETKNLGTVRLQVERLSEEGNAAYRVRLEATLDFAGQFVKRVTHEERLAADLGLLSFTTTSFEQSEGETEKDWTAKGRKEGDRWKVVVESRTGYEPGQSLVEAPASSSAFSEAGLLLLASLLPRGSEDAWAFRRFHWQGLDDYAGRPAEDGKPFEAELEERVEVRAAAPGPLEFRGASLQATRFTVQGENSWIDPMTLDVGPDGRLLAYGEKDAPGRMVAGTEEQARLPLRPTPPIDPNSPRGRLKAVLLYQAGQGDEAALDKVIDWEALRADPPLRRTAPGSLDASTLRGQVIEGLRGPSSRIPAAAVQDLLDILKERPEGEEVVVTVDDSIEMTWRFARKDGAWWIVAMPPVY